MDMTFLLNMLTYFLTATGPDFTMDDKYVRSQGFLLCQKIFRIRKHHSFLWNRSSNLNPIEHVGHVWETLYSHTHMC